MPVDRGSIFADTANFVGPGAGATDGYGNTVQGSATDTVLKANVRIGLFPLAEKRDWIKTIGGGPVDLRDWEIAAPATLTPTMGDAFVVAGGNNPGTYRVKRVTRGPKGSTLVICIVNKEI